MKIFEANITRDVADFFNSDLKRISSFHLANEKLHRFSGITNFFENQFELDIIKESTNRKTNIAEEQDRPEYGDFQTNIKLATNVTQFLKHRLSKPKIIIEPTCGKGNFIIAALSTFENLKNIFGIEIFKPYVWETKFNILQYFISNPTANRPEISIIHFNVFDFDFNQISCQFSSEEILIIGNPPWVTNSRLSSLNSENLPEKSNFKKHSGMDAMTGKGNFDIGEYISLMMFDYFQNFKGTFAFLIKNAVIKNIVFDQKRRSYKVSGLKKYSIDSKKEFNVSVEASLLTCKLESQPEYICQEFDFYNNANILNEFGWVNNNFVSNIEHYKLSKDYDGLCPFEWRQGIKHDCSTIMELERVNEKFVNGLNQEVNLEKDLVYGILKSSDLKETIIENTRKYTIVTQKKVGQETSYIQKMYPQIFQYLTNNKAVFDQRKSSIYKNKPSFSIFGIGDYSFKPFKVTISGLYKSYHFSLVMPQNGKPNMLDDTCYFIGFDTIEFAAYSLILLNSSIANEFLKSITFYDAKRTFTKEVLMRIDLLKLSTHFNNIKIQQEINVLNSNYKINIKANLWQEFIEEMKSAQPVQLKICI